MIALTTVEVGDRTIASATARAEGSVRTATARLPENFAGLEPAARAEAFRKALEVCGVADHRFSLVLPRRNVILREFELPPGEPEEIQQMIRFQLERDLPLPMEDVRFSYTTATGPDGKVRVVAAAVPHDVLDTILAALEGAGFRPAHVYVSCFGLASLAPEGPNPSAVVAMTNGHAEIVIAEGGAHVFSRSAPIPERSCDVLAMELERTLLSYSGRFPGRTVEDMTLAASGPEAEEIARGVSQRLGRTLKTLETAECGLEAAAALGVSVAAAKRPDALPDVLHPPVIKRKFRLTRMHRIVGIAALSALVVLVLSQLLMSARVSRLAELEASLKELQPRVETVKATMAHIQQAREWDDLRFPWIDLLKDLSERIDPAMLIILNANFEDSGAVRLTGKAKSEDAFNDLLKKLGESKFFKSAGFEYRQRNQDKSDYRWDFAIKGELAGFEKKKAKK